MSDLMMEQLANSENMHNCPDNFGIHCFNVQENDL